MTEARLSRPDSLPVGEVPIPVFAALPDASALFHARAERLRWLARGHDLKPYLLFLAGLADMQHRVQATRPGEPLEPDALPAPGIAIPPLRRARLVDTAALKPTLDALTLLAHNLDMPDAARAALTQVCSASDGVLNEMIRSVLAVTIRVQMLAEHSFVAAALQVHFTRLAERLAVDALTPQGHCVCPACGHPPVASMLVGWRGAQGARYCGCAVCGTLWNHVRIKCTICGSTKGISYQEIQGSKALVHAETCTSCRSYMKIIRHDKDAAADPIADDVASLGLDLLMQGTQFRRGGVNPFLLGY